MNLKKNFRHYSMFIDEAVAIENARTWLDPYEVNQAVIILDTKYVPLNYINRY